MQKKNKEVRTGKQESRNSRSSKEQAEKRRSRRARQEEQEQQSKSKEPRIEKQGQQTEAEGHNQNHNKRIVWQLSGIRVSSGHKNKNKIRTMTRELPGNPQAPETALDVSVQMHSGKAPGNTFGKTPSKTPGKNPGKTSGKAPGL